MTQWIRGTCIPVGARLVASHMPGHGSLSDILATDRNWRHRTDLDDFTKHELLKLELQIEDLDLGEDVPTAGQLRDDGPPGDW